MLPPVTAVEVGPNRAKDSAQPVRKVSPSNKPKIFFILPFLYFPYLKQRFVRYKTNESLIMSLYILQPDMEMLIYDITLKGLFFKQPSRFSII